MANPLTIQGFPDTLDPRFFQITDGVIEEEKDRIGEFYTVKVPDQYTMRGSALTGMGLFSVFTGSLTYDGPDQGYDWSSFALEYAKGTTVERLLIEYDQFDIIETRFRLLAEAARNTRQIEAAATFANGFVVDPGYTHTEGVALFSDSHTTTRAGVSTSTGFDNNTTLSFSPTALKAIFIMGRRFKQDNGQPIDDMGFDTVIGPPELLDRAEEIFGTMRGLDAAEGTKNVLEGRYNYKSWNRLVDTNNYFVVNNRKMKENLFWFDKQKPEFARMEEFDGFTAKYRGYYIAHRGRADWRFGIGSNVS